MTQGEYMRRARQKAGLTAPKLSELSGVCLKTIYELELGKVAHGRLDNIMLLADALGLSIDEYVGHRVRTRKNVIKEFAARLKKQYETYDEYDELYVKSIRFDIDCLEELMLAEKARTRDNG